MHFVMNKSFEGIQIGSHEENNNFNEPISEYVMGKSYKANQHREHY